VFYFLFVLSFKKKTKTLESTTDFIKATPIKRDKSDSQNLTKVLHQEPLQMCFKVNDQKPINMLFYDRNIISLID